MTGAIRTVAVCGAGGTMGAGIAIVAARAGFRTLCHDVSGTLLEKARGQSAAF
ncbi:MAG TPA: 3-hydroxyacyl-CoA dehydrogenase NAD-binding domain-containing protein, partial [Hyphomicrobiales bacterium]